VKITLIAFAFLSQFTFALSCSDKLASPPNSPEDQLRIVREFAIKAHGNQMYGKQAYVEHLDEVVAVLRRFGYSDLNNPLHLLVLKAAYLHDVIEDSKLASRSELRKMAEEIAGFEAADAAWRVTDEDIPGADRKQRKLATYPKIKGYYIATLVKLADRIANFESSIRVQSIRHINMYVAEYDSFRIGIYSEGIGEPLWQYLDQLISKHRH
jgi:(p)ppGpp synthase/HD superfamily hydrolase